MEKCFWAIQATTCQTPGIHPNRSVWRWKQHLCHHLEGRPKSNTTSHHPATVIIRLPNDHILATLEAFYVHGLAVNKANLTTSSMKSIRKSAKSPVPELSKNIAIVTSPVQKASLLMNTSYNKGGSQLKISPWRFQKSMPTLSSLDAC